ncbi:hypothetical protein [Vibrio sp. F13]|uniref:hypothetical protein n=1 Tax=Vibrio sp. F13 TaxID=2070777 RepID=UPI0014838554|nr:hypothetical protein [Vibrio sp. F13]
MSQEYVVEVQETNYGEGFVEIPSQILNELDLKEGDTILLNRLDDYKGVYIVGKQP